MPTRNPDLPEVYPKTRVAWRKWLEQHHDRSVGVWLVLDKKKPTALRLTTNEAIEEALCFGWIDSRPNKLDEDRFLLLMTPRKPQSAWSKINRERVGRLIQEGKMTPAGQAMIDLAKERETWLKLEPFESQNVPPDLANALNQVPKAQKFFASITSSARTQILRWIGEAKRPETRARRISETVRLAALGEKPNQYRPPSTL